MGLLTLLALASAIAVILVSFWPHRLSKFSPAWVRSGRIKATDTQTVQTLRALADCHETAAVLVDLIHNEGAGSWPPRANHAHNSWPEALRPYKEIYLELAPLLPQVNPSLDDQVNTNRISSFRSQFQKLLCDRVDRIRVRQLLEAADAGRWDVIPREVYNAFYCCIASSRHAYRWATIPVVRVAQLEKVVDLPPELVEPWAYLQRHFGCASESGNNTSNLVLNFDEHGKHAFKINTGMSAAVLSGEEAFARIFYDVEVQALPVYRDMVQATIAFARGDKAACAGHMASITAQLRFVLGSYYDHMHDQVIARTVWLPHVQGFFAWGVGYLDEESNEWVKFDGLSGNQVLLFQAIDAFLGIEPYLSVKDQERNVPIRQRALCKAFAKHSFRRRLVETPNDEYGDQIANEFSEIVKRIRLFRHAHRVRAKTYLSQPAPERLPMTAGKSLLKSDIEQSLDFLDQFMVGRLAQTA